jgi:hypothetical protein
MSLKRRAILQAGLPVLAMTAIGSALYAQGDAANGRSTLAMGVIIGAVAGAATIYRIERWALWRQSVAHFAVMAVTVLPALFLSGWFPLNGPVDILKVIGMFLAVGAVLWSTLFLIFSRLERRAEAAKASAQPG